jgi:hypothetical protein
MNRTFERDEELGNVLRELETPDHALEFESRLFQRIRDERLVRAGAARRRLGLRLVAVAAILAAAVGFGISRFGGPDAASAADIQARLRATLGSVANVQGRLLEVSRNPLTGARTTGVWSFAMTANGDFGLSQQHGVGRVAYDAETGVERQLNSSASMGTGLFASVRSGLAPGPPDAGPTDSILERDLGAVVRALLAARAAQVRETRYEGREAWSVDLPVQPNAIYPDADNLQVTVDQATGLPIRVLETLRGERRRVLRVERLTLDAALPQRAFDLRLPAGVETFRTDYGFHRLQLEDAGAAVGYAPLVPSWVPDGFTLAEVAVAEHAASTGTEAGNPRSEDVVSLAYRRGFDELIVTTRRAGDDRWSDPLATGEGFLDHPQGVPIDTGALAGAKAQVLVSPRAIPHLWTIKDGLVVTVGGDLDRAGLLRIASSLERAR